jgi:hypothetical protein
MPHPSVAPIHVVEPSVDGTTWTVLVDGVVVNRGEASSHEEATAAAELVAASCIASLSAVGLPGRVQPTA